VYSDAFFVEQFGGQALYKLAQILCEDKIDQLKAMLNLRKDLFDLVLMPYIWTLWKLALLLLSIKAKRRVCFETKVKFLNCRFSACL